MTNPHAGIGWKQGGWSIQEEAASRKYPFLSRVGHTAACVIFAINRSWPDEATCANSAWIYIDAQLRTSGQSYSVTQVLNWACKCSRFNSTRCCRFWPCLKRSMSATEFQAVCFLVQKLRCYRPKLHWARSIDDNNLVYLNSSKASRTTRRRSSETVHSESSSKQPLQRQARQWPSRRCSKTNATRTESCRFSRCFTTLTASRCVNRFTPMETSLRKFI